MTNYAPGGIVPPPPRHKTTHAGSRVPTNRSHAQCRCSRHSRLPCPLHSPALYALDAAAHRGHYQDERP